MSPLGLIFIFVLKIDGISGESVFVYNIRGEDVILSCGRASATHTTCSITSWLQKIDAVLTLNVVHLGNVRERSARTARLSLNTNCSLVIQNVSAHDAGLYTCRQWRSKNDHNFRDTDIYLHVLSISPSPSDADPIRDGEVTLVCSLKRYRELPPCERNSIRWVDETETVLIGEGDGYEFLGQINCVSYLNVKRQSGHNRKYTCQFIDQGQKQIEAEYTPVFTVDTGEDQPEKLDSDRPLSSIMLTLRIAGLILMIVITALLIRDRVNRKPPDNDHNVHRDGDEVSYENEDARPAPPTRH